MRCECVNDAAPCALSSAPQCSYLLTDAGDCAYVPVRLTPRTAHGTQRQRQQMAPLPLVIRESGDGVAGIPLPKATG